MYIPKKNGIVALIFICITLSSCKTPAILSYGKSFGHCVGYCNKELILSNTGMTYVQKKNGDKPETKKTIQPLNKEMYNEILSQFNSKSFYLLDSVIGCPDCADGGAEWIELKSGKNKKRVTFEYNQAPEDLKATVNQFRKLEEGIEK